VDEDLPLQTSGPLAGLRGVLNPEPLLGILPESSYKPTPAVPESQIAEARLVEEALSAPIGRPVPVVVSPARTVIAGLWRWLLYGVLAIVIIVVAFLPGLQAAVRPPAMPEAKALYNEVDGMPARSEVLLVFDYDAGLEGELTPQARAVVWHLLSAGHGVLTVGLTPQSTAIAQDLFAGIDQLVYGEHYVDLGYLPPHPASLQAFVIDPFAGRMLSAEGRDAAQTPLGQRAGHFDDLDLVILISGSQDHLRWWIEQVGSQHDVPTVAGVSAAIAPYVRPYHDEMGTGQLRGILSGLAGAAAYEELSGVEFWPNARQNLSLQGYAQVVLAGIVLLSGARGLLGFLGRLARSRTQT
jgi:hypothetical protein